MPPELDSMGIPKVKIPHRSFESLVAIDCNGDAALEQEKKQMLVEYLLLTGVTSQTAIAERIGINRQTVKRLKKQVEFRWSKNHNEKLRVVRNRSLSYLQMLNRELWDSYNSASATQSSKVRVLHRLLQVHDKEMVINGLTPKVIESMRVEEVSSSVDEYKHIDSAKSNEIADSLSTYLKQLTEQQASE